MIVFDLHCARGNHVFEAWFGSSGDFEDQKARALIACPLCGDTAISKAVMAPNVAAKGNQKAPEVGKVVAVTTPDQAPPKFDEMKAMLAKLAEAQAEALKASTWVGRDFDAQARAIDAGESPNEMIHGEVSPDEARALIEDGIDIMPLPLPVVPPNKRN